MTNKWLWVCFHDRVSCSHGNCSHICHQSSCLENGQAVPSSLLLPVLLGFQQYHACLSLVMAGRKRHGNLMDVSLDLACASTLACHFCLYQAQGTNDALRLQWGER